jgi:cell division protein FtsQ
MKKWIQLSIWVIGTIAVFTLLSLAGKNQRDKPLGKPTIDLHVNGEHALLTEDELMERLKRGGYLFIGQTKENLHIHEMERFIKKMSEVKDVKVYSLVGDAWGIDVQIRRPIARIYNIFNESFYLDEDGCVMQTSVHHSARVVAINGFIKDRQHSPSVNEIINNNSLKSNRKLDDLYIISKYVCNDPILQSLIGQIHVLKNGELLLVPLIGDQVILFGAVTTESDVKKKFDKLKIFYKEALPYEGWNKYESINLKFSNQIVCRTKNGVEQRQ